MQKQYSILLLSFLLVFATVSCTKKAQRSAKPSAEIALSIAEISIAEIHLNAARYVGEEIVMKGVYRDFSKTLVRDNFSTQKGKYNFLMEQEGRVLWIRSETKPTAKDGDFITVKFSIETDKKGRFYFSEVVSSQ